MRVYLTTNNNCYQELKFIFDLFAFNKGLSFIYTAERNSADLIIEDSEIADIRISVQFYDLLNSGQYIHKNYFKTKSEFIDSRGFTDYLSSAFYIVNAIQELEDVDDDQFGRFKYENSLQKRFNSVRINVVQDLFDKIVLTTPKLSFLKGNKFKSRIYLSHDIDTINGSLLQDSFYYFKRYKPFKLANVFFKNVLDKPAWFNMDRIMKIESEFDFNSTFFWLVNKGKTKYGLNNSDYDISNKKITGVIQSIEGTQWGNGLHKSASDESFPEELKKLPVNVPANRYHYIRFKPHKDFQKIDEAGLAMDASLGFADAPGFRNGFGMPFMPFNIKQRKRYNFVEVPLNIMDTTYFNYLKFDANRFEEDVRSFVESNSSNCVISILFHNNFISDGKYGNYFKVFKNLLSFFFDSNYKSINQHEIISTYRDEYSNSIND